MTDDPLFSAEERAELERLQREAIETQATIDGVAARTVAMCLQESTEWLEGAERELAELPGTEHPALFDLTQALKWLLEAVRAAQKGPC